ncbi:MAG: hypothetical protein ACLGIA_07905 [Actinomycetes bacterium]
MATQVTLEATVARGFGNPDGSRADLDQVLDDFVTFPERGAYGALATRADDRRVRLIVGAMGAGKTVYLRRLQACSRRDVSMYASRRRDEEPPSTELIVKVCQIYRANSLSERWRRLWRVAILRAVVSHIQHERGLRRALSPHHLEILGRYGTLLGDGAIPEGVYEHLRQILVVHHTEHALNTYLEDRGWSAVQYVLAECLPGLPPICLYLDAVDDNYQAAPMYWLHCQRGLFEAVLHLLRDQDVGGRLHIIVGLRDIVLSSLLQTEQGPKYRGEEHIRVLRWDIDSLRYFLHAKVERLEPDFLMAPAERPGSMLSWLGTTTIRDDRREVDESVETYLLRHTRSIPRDVVTLGNALSDLVESRKAAGREVEPEAVRRVVSRSARGFAEAQLAQAANQLLTDLMPPQAARRDFLHSYMGADAYLRPEVADTLRRLIAVLTYDRFGRDDLTEWRRLASDAVAELEPEGRHIDLATILWQNGLLGFVRRERGETTFHFYDLSEVDHFSIPLDELEYVLHPSLLDAIPSLRSAGAEPVSALRRFL